MNSLFKNVLSYDNNKNKEQETTNVGVLLIAKKGHSISWGKENRFYIALMFFLTLNLVNVHISLKSYVPFVKLLNILLS